MLHRQRLGVGITVSQAREMESSTRSPSRRPVSSKVTLRIQLRAFHWLQIHMFQCWGRPRTTVRSLPYVSMISTSIYHINSLISPNHLPIGHDVRTQGFAGRDPQLLSKLNQNHTVTRYTPELLWVMPYTRVSKCDSNQQLP